MPPSASPPMLSAMNAGRWTETSPGRTTSSISSGWSPWTKTRAKCAAAASAASSPWKRATSLRASACLASRGGEVGWLLLAQEQPVPALHGRVRDAHRLPVHLLRRLGHPDLVAEGLRHLPLAVDPGEDRHRERDLLGLAVRALDVAPEEQVELLVRAAELDVGANRDRVVALHERIEQLEDRNGLTRGEALGEVVALEDLRHGRRAREAEELLHGHVEPLGVEPHLGLLAVEDLEGLLRVRARVGVDLLTRELRAQGGAPARIPDAGGVVAHDEDHDVAAILELPQLLQDDRVTEVDVRSGGVQTELDAQRTAPRELALQLAGREAVDGVAREELGVRGGGDHGRQC